MQRTVSDIFPYRAKMKILIVANGFPPTAYGGVEIYAQNLARTLLNRDHSVLVFCRESNANITDYTIQRDEVDGINVIRLINDYKQIGTFTDTYTDTKIDVIFNQVLQEFKPDLVHFNHLIALSANLPRVAKSADIPMLTTIHDYWSFCHRVHLQDWRKQQCYGPYQGGDCYRCVIRTEKRRTFLRKVLRWGRSVFSFSLRQRIRLRIVDDAARIIAVTGQRTDFDSRNRIFRENLRLSNMVYVPSEYVRRAYAANGYDDVEMRVLPLGVEVPEDARASRYRHDRLTLGYIGTIVPSKGLHILLRAFHEWNVKRARLLIYGRQDVDQGYQSRIGKIADGDQRIQFIGPFDPKERDAVFNELDYLVIPSVVPETFSLVAREALIRGVPVIASNIGALPEIIIPGENGYLFTPGDVISLQRIFLQIPDEPEPLVMPDPFKGERLLSIDQHVDHLVNAYENTLRASYSSGDHQ
jgi:glycosyltransferase involved in cell wall biosynthesis